MVRNLTRKTIIPQNAKLAKSFIDRTLGMILQKNASGLIFNTRFGLHTFFMKSSIDVLVLDSEGTVQQIAKLKPFRLFFWDPKFSTIIELPMGAVGKSKTQKGDKLEFL